jgi:tetratricopeptide (TPR) repeat protein
VNNNIHITEEELQQIDQYLSGQSSPAEKEFFEQRLKTDSDWAAKFKEIKLLSVGIQETSLREQLDAMHKNTFGESKPTVVRSMRWVKKLAAAAVLFVVISTLGWFFFLKKSSEEKLFLTYYKPDPGLATVMSVSDNYEFERAMVDYKTGDFSGALERWKKQLQQNAGNDTLQYFIASAQMANKEQNSAMDLFDKVIANKNSVFNREAYWYKGLALLQQGKKQEAAMAIEQSDHPQKAALLLKLKDR